MTRIVRGGNGEPADPAFVLSHEEWQRWMLGLPEPRERVDIDPATVAEVVRLQRWSA